jgi:hypothetical protein
MDAERRSLFSLSGYKGDRPLMGSVVGSRFSIQKGAIAVMILPHVFTGVLSRKWGGRELRVISTHQNGRGGSCGCALVSAILLGVPGFVVAVIEVAKGSTGEQGARVGLIVPPASILLFIVLPKFGRLLGQKDEQEILRHIQSTPAARLDGSVSDR